MIEAIQIPNDGSQAPSGRVHPLVSLAGFYGINPFITFEDVWPFGDPHDVGKLKPDLEDQIIAAELKRRGIDTETSFKATHAMLDALIAKANAVALPTASEQPPKT